MNRHRRPIRSGFTLLEAVLALVILAAVLIVCLQIRVQGVKTRAALVRTQQQDQAVEAIFQQVIHNVLPGGEVDDGGAIHWKGEHLGRPFTIDKQPTFVNNPVQRGVTSDGTPAAPTVRIFEYTITWDNTSTSFYWHR
ncbi:MAG: prepilin-type N-terminal cleavage/methylation domain-containing protein [Phycisphaerales bacterium]|nr:prepilin-type N-terminal cleavage/methylation domain-containing protein [Phycisphaerales bacterium]